VRVYPGADGSFTLFSDDGQTYAYEKGAGSVTRLHWDDAADVDSSRAIPPGAGRIAELWKSPDIDLRGTSAEAARACERMKRQGCASADTPVCFCRV
jgi:hypothetical protein